MSSLSTDTESIEQFLDHLEKKIKKDNDSENDDTKIKQIFNSISEHYKVPDTVNEPFFIKSSYTHDPVDIFSSTRSYSEIPGTPYPGINCPSVSNLLNNFNSMPFVYVGKSKTNTIITKTGSIQHIFPYMRDLRIQVSERLLSEPLQPEPLQPEPSHRLIFSTPATGSGQEKIMSNRRM